MTKIAIAADVLVQATLGGKTETSLLAERVLSQADLIAVPLGTICSFVSQLHDQRGIEPTIVGDVVRCLINAKTVAADRAAISAGLAVFESGGSFHDGVAALEGRRMGMTSFVTLEATNSAHIAALIRQKF